SDPAAREKLIGFSMVEAIKQPPADFVPAMAGALDYAPDLRANFESMAARWVAVAPNDAMTWLTENARQSGQDTALSVMAAQLANSGKRDSLKEWVDANPNAPGQAAIAAGKSAVPPP